MRRRKIISKGSASDTSARMGTNRLCKTSSVASRAGTIDPGLYLVATPIGNARDITLRALDVLCQADVLVAEDTRRLRQLLRLHSIAIGRRPLLAYHEHNSTKARPGILAALDRGSAVALASDAGTPLIADPGHRLVRVTVAAGHRVTVIPGPCALTAAASISGLGTDRIHFAGFLPAAPAARRMSLRELSAVDATVVVFEAPHRLAQALVDAAEIFGGTRRAVLCREITKRFEDVRRGTLAELSAHAKGCALRGEMTIVFDRARTPALVQNAKEGLIDELRSAMVDMSLRDAVDLVAGAHGHDRRTIYRMALQIRQADQ